VWATAQKRVQNARGRNKTLQVNGFELVDHPLDPHVNYFDMEEVVHKYYPAVEALVKHKTGASIVAAFDHNVRSMQGFKGGEKLQGTAKANVQQPLAVVHGDYTMTSAPERVKLLTEQPKVNDTYRIVTGDKPLLPKVVLAEGTRFMLINVWRNIREEPIDMYPLAVADTSTVDPSSLVTFEIHYTDRIGENYFCVESGEQEWFYYPRMRRDEALLFKQWDSQGKLATGKDGADSSFCLHTAFADPETTESSPDRASIEVRLAAIFN